jgi:hypothetical protein
MNKNFSSIPFSFLLIRTPTAMAEIDIHHAVFKDVPRSS